MVKITVLKNGPLMIEGEVELYDDAGNLLKKKKKIFLCRCGKSANKPYCDGTHTKVHFVG